MYMIQYNPKHPTVRRSYVLSEFYLGPGSRDRVSRPGRRSQEARYSLRCRSPSLPDTEKLIIQLFHRGNVFQLPIQI